MSRVARLKLVAVLSAVVALGAGAALVALRDLPQWHLDIEAAMDAIGLQAGMVVGEAGAGTGYFTLPMAHRVGKDGAVYANDINRRSLASLEAHAKRDGLSNVHTVVGEVADPLFPRRDLDFIVVVHALHDFDRPVEWLASAKKYLRPGGVVAIIDLDPEQGGDSHFWSRGRIEGYAHKAGYVLTKAVDSTSDHLILLFAPAPGPS